MSNQLTNLRFDTIVVATLGTATHPSYPSSASTPSSTLTLDSAMPFGGEQSIEAATTQLTNQYLVVSESFISVSGSWQTELSLGYQQLGEALLGMTEAEDEDGPIDAPVYNVAHFLAASLMNYCYPAPKLFSHGSKSVVFNWVDSGNNLYLTVSADRIAAMISSPERIKGRFEVSTDCFANVSELLPVMKSAQIGGPVVTRDGSLDLIPQSIT